jgi:hypothetical protein
MNALESSSNTLDERSSRKEQRRKTLAGVAGVFGKVLLSYFDLLTDAVLAITLLGTEQATYGVVSFGILATHAGVRCAFCGQSPVVVEGCFHDRHWSRSSP